LARGACVGSCVSACEMARRQATADPLRNGPTGTLSHPPHIRNNLHPHTRFSSPSLARKLRGVFMSPQHGASPGTDTTGARAWQRAMLRSGTLEPTKTPRAQLSCLQAGPATPAAVSIGAATDQARAHASRRLPLGAHAYAGGRHGAGRACVSASALWERTGAWAPSASGHATKASARRIRTRARRASRRRGQALGRSGGEPGAHGGAATHRGGHRGSGGRRGSGHAGPETHSAPGGGKDQGSRGERAGRMCGMAPRQRTKGQARHRGSARKDRPATSTPN
jgi:hypothetical protein